MVDRIASIAALHWVDNFRPCEKHMRLLVKRVKLLTRIVSLGELEVRLVEIWRNRELSKLGILLEENGKWFAKTLQWAMTKKR